MKPETQFVVKLSKKKIFILEIHYPNVIDQG